MPKNLNVSLENESTLASVATALDSKIRRTILSMTANGCYSVSEISKKLNMPLSTLSPHLKLLEDASLITITQNATKRGKEKVISRGLNSININLIQKEEFLDNSTMFNIPIGSFTDCKVKPSCGLADKNGFIITDDNPSAFYLPERVNAQLIWFSEGYVEYRIPNDMLVGKVPKSIIISCEICSECPNYNVEWQSDISFFINGVEVCTVESPGDMGGRSGKFTPPSWSSLASQFGFLKNIIVNVEGTYIDQYRASAVTVSRLNLTQGDFISLKIGVKDSAKHLGGVNLFGENFGDYSQGLLAKIDWQN